MYVAGATLNFNSATASMMVFDPRENEWLSAAPMGTARVLIAKLSSLLRQRLKSRDHFVTLREELESIDQYLDIEVVRFGPNLRVEKRIAPDTLGVVVPAMILQPLIPFEAARSHYKPMPFEPSR